MIFGTDGVRDRAGEGFLTPDSVERIAAATAFVLADRRRFGEDFPPSRGGAVVLARDTRASGPGIAAGLARAFARFGHEVFDAGVLPTPGVAAVAAAWEEALLGVMVSASHNPAEWNGIKFLGPLGAKISTAFEEAVSRAYWDGSSPPPAARAAAVSDRAGAAFEAYVARLAQAARRPGRWSRLAVVLDLGNGATYAAAPEVFRRLGARVATLADRPDGRNINLDCGALHPQGLAALVRERGAAAGFSFDGDGDRMIPVTARGTVLDGDHVLYVTGNRCLRDGRLPLRTVVATVMSNMGLEVALRKAGMSLLRTDVGDRNVYAAMVEKGHPVGGEQSGHLIFLDDARTGDGILAAIRLIEGLEGEPGDLEAEAAAVPRYPQVLKNLRVREKRPFASLPGVPEAIAAAEARLGADGRVNVRYSGTEPLARVMIEGPDGELIGRLADAIIQAIAAAEGAG